MDYDTEHTTKRRTALLGLAFVASSLTACGSDPAPDADDDATTEDSPSEDSTRGSLDPTDTAGSTTSDATETSPEDDTSGSSSAGEPRCELPQNDAVGSAVTTITIANTTAEPRFISPYSTALCNYSQVEVLLGGEPVLWDHEATYPNACTICEFGCSDGGTEGFIINPGQVAEVLWNGGFWQGTTRSEACTLEACGSDDGAHECEVLRVMDEVEYTVRVNVFDACPESVEPDACACDEGVCEVFFYEPRAGDYTVEATATFPAGAAVVLE